MNVDSQIAEACSVILAAVRAIVTDKGAVTVLPIQSDDRLTVIQVRTSCRSDMGKVIGKQGRMAFSLRVVLQAIGKEQRKQYRLDIMDMAP